MEAAFQQLCVPWIRLLINLQVDNGSAGKEAGSIVLINYKIQKGGLQIVKHGPEMRF